MRRKIFLASVLLILAAFLVACGGDQADTLTVEPIIPTPTTPEVDPFTAQLDQLIQNRHPSFSGTILVAIPDEEPRILSYGLANRELNVPNNAETKYQIGSITKSFTALAIMMLAEDGLLSVDDPLCDYLADCPGAWQSVTLHQLLTHSSGIPNMSDLYVEGIIEAEACAVYTTAEVVDLFDDFPLDFAPGSSFYYGNSGYFLLGMVIEAVTGETYADFVQENILDPLGMTDTGYNDAAKIIPNRAAGYSVDLLELINAPDTHVSVMYAMGGLYSTVGDLHTWAQAFTTDQLVSQTTRDNILTGYMELTSDSQYGYGWILGAWEGLSSFEHGGLTSGFATNLAHYPDERVTIIVLSNYDQIDVDAIHRDIWNLVFFGE